MSHTQFQEGTTSTPITCEWANDVDAVTYQDAGPTASRPAVPRKIGMVWFDTQLGYPVWCSQIVPSVIWVDSSGVAC